MRRYTYTPVPGLPLTVEAPSKPAALPLLNAVILARRLTTVAFPQTCNLVEESLP
jgi:hypothetical protein